MKQLIPAAAIAVALLPTLAEAEPVRFATFNASMNRADAGDLADALATGADNQIKAVAEIIQRVDPDILLINEFDYGVGLPAAFIDNYLQLPQNVSGVGPSTPTSFAHTFIAPSNTGVQSGFDLDNDGVTGGPGDAFGFGFFEGQFGMAVFSKHEILVDQVRTFQTFRWADMPGARLPTDPSSGDPWYSNDELEVLRLSSKSHWDVPVRIGGQVVHLLASHPTPPAFDGPENRNGLRNADEIRFWADYVSDAGYIYDDDGVAGGLAPGSNFVIAGDQNADPFDGASESGAIQQLLDLPFILGSDTNPAITPASLGGPHATLTQADNNMLHIGDPGFDTADFAEGSFAGPGNLRVDYVLPSTTLGYLDGGVFWPDDEDPLFALVGGGFPAISSDHRLVWADVNVTPQVPLPPTAVLLLGGLLGMACCRFRGHRVKCASPDPRTPLC